MHHNTTLVCPYLLIFIIFGLNIDLAFCALLFLHLRIGFKCLLNSVRLHSAACKSSDDVDLHSWVREGFRNSRCTITCKSLLEKLDQVVKCEYMLSLLIMQQKSACVSD